MSDQGPDLGKCQSCGLPLQSTDAEGTPCHLCTLNNSQQPLFDAIVSAIADGFFMIKQGITAPNIALEKASTLVTKNPYWISRPEAWTSPELLETEFYKMRINAQLAHALYNLDESALAQENPDIFISHSWDGPDAELVDPLVARLKALGYTVWYDKEQGLKPGDVEKYFDDQIESALNCIPILCQAYFRSNHAVHDLQTIFQVKEKKHIFPVWWTDVDKEFLNQQPACGEEILNCVGITWENCNQDLDQLVTQLNEYLLTAKGLAMYNGVELLELEQRAMQDLEKIIGEKIPVVTKPNGCPIGTLGFGFTAEANHVIGLVLRKTQTGRVITPLTLPQSFDKLILIQQLSVPLLQIPARIGNLSKMEELDLNGGTSSLMPESVIDLTNLKSLRMKDHVLAYPLGTAEEFFDRLIKERGYYSDLRKEEAICLFLLQLNLGSDAPIPSVLSDNEYGYRVNGDRVIGLNIKDTEMVTLSPCINQLSTIQSLKISCISRVEVIVQLSTLKSLELNNSLPPESIGQLTSLESLALNQYTKDWRNGYVPTPPESIGLLSALKSLKLNCASLPESIGQLSSLQSLDLMYGPPCQIRMFFRNYRFRKALGI